MTARETTLACPYCGETIELLVDCSLDEQEYVEDCSVCCRPITLVATAVDGELTGLESSREDD